MRRAGALLRERKDELARLMALEMGKPLAQGRAEAEKCAWVCDYYADTAEGFLKPEAIPTDASRSFVAFSPLGIVLAVMPWNFPLWQVFRFVAPGLMAGNAGILKHSSNVSGCALAIEEIVLAAGFPKGLFRTLLVSSKAVAGIIEAPEVKAVTLTGSTPAGRSVAATAGRALKKTVLELGAAIPTWSSRTPTSSWRPRAAPPRASSTAGRAASRPSASSWWSRCASASRSCSSRA